jgi:hypothetical protein
MSTHRLNVGAGLLLERPEALDKRSRVEQDDYVLLPLDADEEQLQRTHWRLLLELTGSLRGLMVLEIVGDVTLGWGDGGAFPPNLDMEILNAYDMGLSRQHILLRPTDNHLYLIDLDSSNGTRVNGGTHWAGEAHALAEGDQLSLAKLSMRVASLEKVPGTLPGPDTDLLPPPPKRAESDEPPATAPLED